MREIILLAEDAADDQVLIKQALAKLAPRNQFHLVPDGDQAIRYLLGDGEYSDRKRFPLPTLIFLDIKMPRKDGFQVLEWLKGNTFYTRIPVVIVSSSWDPYDIERAQKSGAMAYVVKSPAMEGLQELFAATGDFGVKECAFAIFPSHTHSIH